MGLLTNLFEKSTFIGVNVYILKKIMSMNPLLYKITVNPK